MRGNNLCKWNVRERDSCLRAVLCYKDEIYKGLYGNFTGLVCGVPPAALTRWKRFKMASNNVKQEKNTTGKQGKSVLFTEH